MGLIDCDNKIDGYRELFSDQHLWQFNNVYWYIYLENDMVLAIQSASNYECFDVIPM